MEADTLHNDDDENDYDKCHVEEQHEDDASWIVTCPRCVPIDVAEDIVEDAERRMRIAAWIMKAGLHPRDSGQQCLIDKARGEECASSLVDVIRRSVRRRIRDVSILCPLRDEHVAVFGWTELYEKDIDFLVKVILRSEKSVIEMGAGSGWIAYLLAQRGIEVEAYDLGGCQGVGGETFIHDWKSWPWFQMVQEGGIEVLENQKTNDKCLLLCWPDVESGFATKCLNLFQGNSLVYIGEFGKDSCTAETSFFALLKDEWILEDHRSTGHAEGVNDGIYFYERSMTIM